MDGYGNFDQAESDGTDCVTDAFVRAAGSNSIALRGPGQDTVGYCLLATPVSLSTAGLRPLTSNYPSRAIAKRIIRIVVDPSTATAPATAPALATTGPDLVSIVVTGLGALLLLAAGAVTMRRRRV